MILSNDKPIHNGRHSDSKQTFRSITNRTRYIYNWACFALSMGHLFQRITLFSHVPFQSISKIQVSDSIWYCPSSVSLLQWLHSAVLRYMEEVSKKSLNSCFCFRIESAKMAVASSWEEGMLCDLRFQWYFTKQKFVMHKRNEMYSVQH